VLITGASSGLGLAFLYHYASQPSTQIIALDIAPLPPDAQSLKNVDFHKADITTPSLLLLAQTLEVENRTINLLLHSAGIRGLVPEIVAKKTGAVEAAETYEVMDQDTFMKTLEINTWGTFNVIKSFLPLLKAASTASSEAAKVILMTSRMGSLAANTTGGSYAYRASKSALNSVVKSFSIDVPEVVFLLLHPGRVETGLVGWKEEGAMSVKESLETCLQVIEGLGREESGRFVDRFGESINW
ncbi:hypothetical protein BDV96DRAFT_453253, partial [Lophiotrema nucula]